MSTRWPDVFIVGAPRSGTTFVYDALRAHERLFFPFPKEPLYFCADLNTGTPFDKREFITTQADYLARFEAAGRGQLTGEACVFNLFSSVAAERIHAVRPDARIIICLREPVAQMVSFHAVRVAEGQEDLAFAEALEAAADRLAGRRLPAHAVLVPAYDYAAVARYAVQVERYLATFPRRQVLVLAYDDLERDPQAWLTALATFLDLPLGSLDDPGVVNAQWVARSRLVTRMTRSRAMIGAGKRVVPDRLHPLSRRMTERVGRANRRRVASSKVDAALAGRLRAELAPDVARLGALLDLDLPGRWS